MRAIIAAGITLLSINAFADVYNLDPSASRIEWKAGKKMGSFHNGDVKVKSGKLETDSKGAVKSLNVVADMKSITNEDLKGDAKYQKMLVDHLSGDDFFKTEKHPESTFVLKRAEPKKGSKDEVLIKGDLTMLGKTQPVEFPAKITTKDNTITGVGTLKVERLKWDLQYGSGSIFKSLTADKVINDSFDLTFNLVGKK